ncbi:23S rRNA (pseudouridine(1915)-N(3))-methyltransferase RlmH [Verrucomicrobiota bacterium]
MKVTVLVPGKIKPKQLVEAQSEYMKRLKSYGVQLQEYKDERVDRQPEMVKKAEAERILKTLKPDDYLIACDERGQAVTTNQMAGLMRDLRQGGGKMAGKRRIVIVIGGALGLADSVRVRADEVWAISSLVMAGGVARVVLLEAIYRAFTIVDGHPYHNA